MHESTEFVLVVLSVTGEKAIKFMERVLEKHGCTNTWIVVDRKSVERLVATRLFAKIPSDRLIVYAGRNPEETALRVYVVSKPSKVYICDEQGSLKPITDFLELAPVEIEKC